MRVSKRPLYPREMLLNAASGLSPAAGSGDGQFYRKENLIERRIAETAEKS